MRLYLIRHGQTDLNVAKVYYGWTDCDINKKGVEQAQKTAEFFQSIPLDYIVSSDLLRAKHTAALLAENRAIPILEKKKLREIHFGNWENKNFEYIMKHDAQNYKNWCQNWKTAQIPNGESFEVFYNRVVEVLEELITNYKEKTIAVVAHNGPLCVFLCELTGGGKNSFWHFKIEQQAYCSIFIEQETIIIEKINSSIK